MILIDSSAWIEYYHPRGLPAVGDEVEAAIRADLAAVNGVIKTEIVAFASTAEDYRRLSEDFSSFRWLDLTPADFELAVDLGFRLRRQGLTVPATDLIIAASAIRAGVPLYHLDSHFDQIAMHSDLKAENLRG